MHESQAPSVSLRAEHSEEDTSLPEAHSPIQNFKILVEN